MVEKDINIKGVKNMEYKEGLILKEIGEMIGVYTLVVQKVELEGNDYYIVAHGGKSWHEYVDFGFIRETMCNWLVWRNSVIVCDEEKFNSITSDFFKEILSKSGFNYDITITIPYVRDKRDRPSISLKPLNGYVMPMIEKYLSRYLYIEGLLELIKTVAKKEDMDPLDIFKKLPHREQSEVAPLFFTWYREYVKTLVSGYYYDIVYKGIPQDFKAYITLVDHNIFNEKIITTIPKFSIKNLKNGIYTAYKGNDVYAIFVKIGDNRTLGLEVNLRTGKVQPSTIIRLPLGTIIAYEKYRLGRYYFIPSTIYRFIEVHNTYLGNKISLDDVSDNYKITKDEHKYIIEHEEHGYITVSEISAVFEVPYKEKIED